MKDKILKISYFIFMASFFLPWFTFNARIMGYCMGINFSTWFIAPVLLVGIFIFKYPDKGIWKIIAEISMAADIVLLIMAIGKWQEISNIQEGFHFKEGLVTATPAYWISVAVHISFTVMLQIYFRQHSTDK